MSRVEFGKACLKVIFLLMIILYENNAVSNVFGLGDIRKQLSLCKRKREEDGESRHICAAWGNHRTAFRSYLSSSTWALELRLRAGLQTYTASAFIHSRGPLSGN